MRLLDEVLEKLLGGYGYGKGGIVGARGDVFVGVDDFFDAGDYGED